MREREKRYPSDDIAHPCSWSNLIIFWAAVRKHLINSSLLHFTFQQSISNSLCSDNCISNISFMRPLQLLCCCRKYLQKGNNLAMMDFPLRKRPSEMEEAPTWPEKVKNWIHHHFRQAVWDGIGVRNHPTISRSRHCRIWENVHFVRSNCRKTTFDWPKVVSEVSFGGYFLLQSGLRFLFRWSEMLFPRYCDTFV